MVKPISVAVLAAVVAGVFTGTAMAQSGSASSAQQSTLLVSADLPAVSGNLTFTVAVAGTPVNASPSIPIGPADLPTLTAQLSSNSPRNAGR